MKPVIVALLLLLVVSQCESLRCHCGGPARPCFAPVETCPPSHTFCGKVFIFSISTTEVFYRGCMEPQACRGLDNPGGSSATCCSINLCNV